MNYCLICNNLTENDICVYCSSTTRDRSQICVIEENFSLSIIEKTGNYKGLYHILHGSLSPPRGIGPDKLKLKNLFTRLMPDNNQEVLVKEIFLATNPTIESATTANYIERLLKPLGFSVNKIKIEMEDVFETETIQ